MVKSSIKEIDGMKVKALDLINSIAEVKSNELESFITAKEVQSILKISRPTLIKYTQLGLLRDYRIGNKKYYRKDELLDSFKTSEVDAL